MRQVASFVLFLLLLSCAPAATDRPENTAPSEEITWPPPPERARIKLLYAFSKPEDLGFRASFFESFARVIAGKKTRGMVRPYAIVADDQIIVVADPGLRVLHIFDIKRKKYRTVTEAAGTPLVSPVGVAISGNEIYLADSSLEKVFILSRDGKLRGTIDGMKRPTGLAYHAAADRLYVAETLGHRIAAFDGQGRRLFEFGTRGSGDGEFNYPTHVTLRDDQLYVNDTMNFRLQAFNLDGVFQSSFGQAGDGSGDFAQSKGVAVDSEHHVYVVDALFGRVQIFDTDGRFLLAFGEDGSGLGRFWLPAGIFISQDRVFVADSYNRRVQVFAYIGGES